MLSADHGILCPKLKVTFRYFLDENIQTLSSKPTPKLDEIFGHLFVPKLDVTDPCTDISLPYIPQNVTRRSNISTNDRNIIALVPWVKDTNCTLSFLAAAADVSATIVYLPDFAAEIPPPVYHPVWDLGEGGRWKVRNRYPVYAIPGPLGAQLMHQLALYEHIEYPLKKDITGLWGASNRSTNHSPVSASIQILHNHRALASPLLLFLLFLGIFLLLAAILSVPMRRYQRKRQIDLHQRFVESLPLFKYVASDAPLSNNDIATVPFPISCIPHTISTLREAKPALPTTSGSLLATVPPLPIDSRGPSSFTLPSTLLQIRQSKYTQPTCSICLDDFESGSTVVRQLPCQHIYHPRCIDVLLQQKSSLCPLCKCRISPISYSPEFSTNAIAHRDRPTRRRQQQEVLEMMEARRVDPEDGHEGWFFAGRRIRSPRQRHGQPSRIATNGNGSASVVVAPSQSSANNTSQASESPHLATQASASTTVDESDLTSSRAGASTAIATCRQIR